MESWRERESTREARARAKGRTAIGVLVGAEVSVGGAQRVACNVRCVALADGLTQSHCCVGVGPGPAGDERERERYWYTRYRVTDRMQI